jgi:hypothetical protein
VRIRNRIREVYDFDAMSGATPEAEPQSPRFTTAGVLGALALFTTACLIFLQGMCFDVPIHTAIDLEHKGVPVIETIEFKQRDRTYAYGFAFRPSFVKGRDWFYTTNSEAEEKKAWAELCPTVDVAIVDSSGVTRMREISRLSDEDGWTMTNSSQEDRPASVYKFLTFKPVPGEAYQLRVSVVEGCAGSNALSPVFFIDMPTASL